MNMRGQRVLVAGGTSGIGLATALASAQAGAEVFVASRSESRVADALARLPAGSGGRVVDFTDDGQIREWFAAVGPYDHLIYTAGESLKIGSIDDLPVDAARLAFEVRYWGAFKAVKYGHAQIRRGGSIVLTSGIAAMRPGRQWTVPSSIGGAVQALTRALAVELAPLRVNAVSPGLVKTSLWDNMTEDEREATYARVKGAC